MGYNHMGIIYGVFAIRNSVLQINQGTIHLTHTQNFPKIFKMPPEHTYTGILGVYWYSDASLNSTR